MPPKAVTGKGLGPVLGLYSHGMVAPAGEIVVVAGQVGTDSQGRLVDPGDVFAQTVQAFANIEAVLRAAGSGMRDVIRFQTFLTRASDVDGFMLARRQVFARCYPDDVYPPNTLLVVSRLVQQELLVEIEAMAVKPARKPAPRPAASTAKAKRGTARLPGRRPSARRR